MNLGLKLKLSLGDRGKLKLGIQRQVKRKNASFWLLHLCANPTVFLDPGIPSLFYTSKAPMYQLNIIVSQYGWSWLATSIVLNLVAVLKTSCNDNQVFELDDVWVFVWLFSLCNTAHILLELSSHDWGFLLSFCNPPMTVSKNKQPRSFMYTKPRAGYMIFKSCHI